MQPTRLEGKVDKGWGYEVIWQLMNYTVVKLWYLKKLVLSLVCTFIKKKMKHGLLITEDFY